MPFACDTLFLPMPFEAAMPNEDILPQRDVAPIEPNGLNESADDMRRQISHCNAVPRRQISDASTAATFSRQASQDSEDDTRAWSLESTPRGNASPTIQTPPVTPRAAMVDPWTPPPLLPNRMSPQPALLTALEKNSVDLVREILQSNPDLASEPFWEHGVEAPLCCAVRLKCDAVITEMLLENGAKLDDNDRHGRTAAKILQQHRNPLREPMLPPFASSPRQGGSAVALTPLKDFLLDEANWWPVVGGNEWRENELPTDVEREAWCQEIEDILQSFV
jgi:hypothetical protein